MSLHKSNCDDFQQVHGVLSNKNLCQTACMIYELKPNYLVGLIFSNPISTIQSYSWSMSWKHNWGSCHWPNLLCCVIDSLAYSMLLSLTLKPPLTCIFAESLISWPCNPMDWLLPSLTYWLSVNQNLCNLNYCSTHLMADCPDVGLYASVSIFWQMYLLWVALDESIC